MTWQGAISRLIFPNGTVIAGCSGATSLARLLLLACLRRAAAASPTVWIKNVIDDVSLHAVGGADVVRRELSRAFSVVTTDFKKQGLPIAWDKLGLLSSSAEVAAGVLEDCALPPEVKCQVHRDLGGDATDGSRRRVSIHQDRFLEAQRKVSKVLALRDAGAQVGNVFRAGVTAKALWGPTSRGSRTASSRRFAFLRFALKAACPGDARWSWRLCVLVVDGPEIPWSW